MGPVVSPYEVVQSENAHYPVSHLCDAVGVSRSAFYDWCRATPSQRAQTNERILTEIRAVHKEHQERYGSPRVRAELRGRGSTWVSTALHD
ncbi:MAG TPA: IS3 family transposase [Polyangiaceae bacterium]|nr:IS3 family transposase [Polyangiaceae bacterium]